MLVKKNKKKNNKLLQFNLKFYDYLTKKTTNLSQFGTNKIFMKLNKKLKLLLVYCFGCNST